MNDLQRNAKLLVPSLSIESLENIGKVLLPREPRVGWGGIFHAWIYDKPRKSGLRDLIHREDFPNGVTNGGIEDNEAVYFNSGTQKTAWYFGLIDNASFSALAAGDTMGSHGGWIENVDYDEATRQQWSPSAPASRVITNPTPAAFTMNATKTIKGAFLTSVNTKSGTTGVLWATGLFGVAQSLTDDQVLRLSYSLTGTSS